MKRSLTTLACLLAVACSAPAALAQSYKVDEAAVTTAAQNTRSRVIIVMEEPARGGQQESFSNPAGYLTTTLAADVTGVQSLAPGSSIAVAEVTLNGLQTLAGDARVKRVFLDEAVEPHLAETTRLMGAAPAWTAGREGRGALVAVLDTGVQADHPFLRGRIAAEACFSSTVESQGSTTACPNNQGEMIGAGAGRPCTANGCNHGTHVAGIVAGLDGHQTPGSTRLDGVARAGSIVAVQVFSNFTTNCGTNPNCPRSYTSDQLKGLLHVRQLVQVGGMPIAAVNMSLGGGRHENYCDADSALTQIVNELTALNVAVVISSGNDGFTNAVGHPACIRSAVSVGSVDKNNAVASYSNSAQIVSILAPGSNVISSNVGSAFVQMSGTSMAAPHVAGSIALLRAAFPNRPLADILAALRSSGVSVTDARNNLALPRVQLDRAVAALGAAAPASCPDAGGDAAIVARVAAIARPADGGAIEKARAVFGADSVVKVMADGTLLVTPKGAIQAAAAPVCPAPPAAVPAAAPPVVPPPPARPAPPAAAAPIPPPPPPPPPMPAPPPATAPPAAPPTGDILRDLFR